MYKSIYRNVFIILFILGFFGISGCLDAASENVGIEKVTKTMKIYDKSTSINSVFQDQQLQFYDYKPKQIIVQPPKTINGWSIIAPDIIYLIYETDLKDNNNNIALDTRSEDSENNIPVPTIYDQYSDNLDNVDNVDSTLPTVSDRSFDD